MSSRLDRYQMLGDQIWDTEANEPVTLPIRADVVCSLLNDSHNVRRDLSQLKQLAKEVARRNGIAPREVGLLYLIEQ